MISAEVLRLSQFQYDLPDERIARFPLPQRDQSKLLIYRKGETTHERFSNLAAVLPAKSFLVFNNTKVIPARLIFQKPTGAVIELFLLNPTPADRPITQAMEDTHSCVWQCMVGNRKRWRPGEILETNLGSVHLRAQWHHYEESLVRLEWTPVTTCFADVIHQAGRIPLPPYLRREATEADQETYQTVYAREEGAVAAPTAGLHFTPAVFRSLEKRGFAYDYLTLHVGAGTFQPIKTDEVRQHTMHAEQVVYTKANIQNLLLHIDSIIPVGTTSMRALESLYWIGVRLIRNQPDPFTLDQHYAYQLTVPEQPSPRAALEAVLRYMDDTRQVSIVAHTSIYITPGYAFRLCKGIVTNFHQPGSTLIVLISALVGDAWRTIYNEALDNGYRFLSYGDSSLLIP
ncbi:S-adenosylmethionine:tRNA ribosyltransferase-isomerase [Nibrella saemangeumensis]|uniref:S-adenosylmethionine:tRNA ribosyltransferase-isomerase n=1 Tax=Nibrella saemangeumensis TaxID=1084526 RepID=A0ABP8NGY2_9BACT